MKKMKNKIILLIISIMVLFTLGGFMAKAWFELPISKDAFYLITTNPGVDTSNEINLNWHASNTGSFVYLYKALDGETKGTKINPDSEKIWSTQGQASVDTTEKFYTERYVCSVTLKNLEPRTKYCYYISNEEVRSDVHSFVTSGLTNDFEFMAFVDFQNPGNNNWKKVLNTVSSKTNDPTLVLCSGDITGCGGNQDEFEWALDGNLDNYIFAASPGDHEYWANDKGSPYPMFTTPYGYNAIFNNPKNGCTESLNSNYYFYQNNVLFIALDMCDSNTSKSAKMDAEVAWFKDTMKKLEGTYQYLVVYAHKSFYGSTQEDSGVRKYIGPTWQALFDTYNVDLSIGGHDHMYSRTYQVYKGKVTTDTNLGTFYLDMGSSGNKYRTPSTDLTSDGLHQKVMDLKTLNYAVGSRIKVSEEKMVVEVISMNGETVDSFEIKAKRNAPKISDYSANLDSLYENTSINAKTTKQAEVIINDSENLKYVKKITILDKSNNILLDENISVSKDAIFKLNKLNGTTYTIKYTLIDGEVAEVKKDISIGSINGLNINYEDDVLSLNFNNEVVPLGSILYRVTIDGKSTLYSSDDFNTRKVELELDNDLLYDSHIYKVELLLNGEVINTLDLIHKVKEGVIINSNIINFDNNRNITIDYTFDEPELLEFSSSDENIVKFENGVITPIHNGEAVVTIKIKDTSIKYNINVTVNIPESEPVEEPVKSGCNTGSVIQTLANVLTIGFGVLGAGALLAFRRKREE